MADAPHQVESKVDPSDSHEDIRIDSTREHSLTGYARHKIAELANPRMAQRVERVLGILEVEIESLGPAQFPPIRLAEGEDGCVALEWMFPHCRLGFSIEPDEKESGWHVVSDESAGSTMACGRLSERSIKPAVKLMLSHLR